MNIKQIFVFAVVVAAMVFGLVRYCDRDRVSPTEPGTLAPHERERIEFKDRIITVIKADKTVRTYAPGGAKVSIRKDGGIDLDVKRLGLCREFGLGAAYTGEGKLKMSLDMKWGYYRRLGGHLGLTIDFARKSEKPLDYLGNFKPLLAASYTMPSEDFTNTSLYVGAEFFPTVYVGGIRLAF